MGETGVEISHKYPTNLFIGETKPKREKKRTRETAQILQKVSKKDEAKHKMFHQAESRWGPFQKRERPPNCLTKLVKITQATLINLVHFYFFLMQWWIDLTLIYITWLPFSDLINLVPHPPTHPPPIELMCTSTFVEGWISMHNIWCPIVNFPNFYPTQGPTFHHYILLEQPFFFSFPSSEE